MVMAEEPPSTTMFWPVTKDEARGAAGRLRGLDGRPADLGVELVDGARDE
jgi:hypothetical protein